jgi:hypothetical protein
MSEEAPSASHLLSADLVRRLRLVRYLYDIAVDQSRRPEPFAGFALLPFHDSVEMFLQIVAEHHGASEKRPDFMMYWTMLREVGVDLPYRASMERLNAARVSLKHRGLLPARSEIEGFRATVTDFLDQSTRSALSQDFYRISLAALISSDTIRQQLEVAEAALTANDFGTALGEAAKAFVLALREHTIRQRSADDRRRGYNLYEAFSPSRLVFGLHLDFHDEVNRLAGTVGEAGHKLAEAIVVVGYNLDFEAYLLFKSHAPVVHEFGDRSLSVVWMVEPTADPEIARRCVNFAIDTAIRLDAIV